MNWGKLAARAQHKKLPPNYRVRLCALGCAGCGAIIVRRAAAVAGC
jgi:hypothetical protein